MRFVMIFIDCSSEAVISLDLTVVVSFCRILEFTLEPKGRESRNHQRIHKRRVLTTKRMVEIVS